MPVAILAQIKVKSLYSINAARTVVYTNNIFQIYLAGTIQKLHMRLASSMLQRCLPKASSLNTLELMEFR